MKRRIMAFILLAGAFYGRGADLATGVAAFERKDYTAALRQLEPLVEQGIAPAEHYVGVMLNSGWGISKDRFRASTLIRRSAEKGFPKAQAFMGHAHFTGAWLVGVEKNDL